MAIHSARISREAETIPLISIRGLLSDDLEVFKSTADEIGDAARKYGFFRICDHGISLALIEATYQRAAAYFALPDAAKQKLYIGHSKNHRGYVPFTEKGDYPDEVNRSYEAFDLGLDLPQNDPDYLAGNRLLGPNVWPDQPDFKATVSKYYGEVAALGHLMCAALEVHLGLQIGAMSGKMKKPISQLRLLHYVRQKSTADHQSVNMGAHTDYECLTLLHTRNKGLQVMTQDNRWIDVPIDPAVFVVNIGDMLEAWSNGILRSTPHRVLNLSPERFSMPYFVAADYHTEIKPFPELVTKDRPAKYQPFVAGAHLERMLIRDFPYLKRQQMAQSPAINPFERRMVESTT